MREIKFRAFNKNSKKFIYSDWKYGIVSFWDNVVHDTDFEPPQQWPGLLDKNGKECYEGDILKTIHFTDRDDTYWLYHKIVWNKEWFLWQAVSLNNKNESLKENGNPMLKVYAQNDFEIIGNIYENPELLTPEAGREK
jgi:uncharacterized phage protein (TIGR01671 family)